MELLIWEVVKFDMLYSRRVGCCTKDPLGCKVKIVLELKWNEFFIEITGDKQCYWAVRWGMILDTLANLQVLWVKDR